MDWFKVTTFWAEKDNKTGKIRYKFRFEKLDPTTTSWWDVPNASQIDKGVKMEFQHCSICQKQSPLIYDSEWMCLQEKCSAFWQVRINFTLHE